MNYASLVPEDSFIGRYMHAASPLETSQSYDFWAAMWVLGTCVGRDVFIDRPHAPVFMNWYVMLVAESGITRKSTAVRMARNFVAEIKSADHIIDGKATPEYLFGRLLHTPDTAIAVSELVTFFGRDSYMIELPALLTDLYDCPIEKRGGTVSKGERVIEAPFVTFMSATTPTWLMGAVNPTVVEGGFTSRCMFVCDEKPKRRTAWPEHHKSLDTALAAMRTISQTVVELPSIRLQPAAMTRFSNWYNARQIQTDNPFLASFLSREDAHVLRAAAGLAINDRSMQISKAHINTAIKLITSVKDGAMQLFSSSGSTVKLAQALEKMTRIIHSHGAAGIGHTSLYGSVRGLISSADFKLAVNYMHELGMLVIAVEQTNTPGPKPRRYFRTKATTQDKQISMLRDALL